MEYIALARLEYNNKQVGIVIIDKNNDNSWDYPFDYMLDNPNIIKVDTSEIPNLVSNCKLYSNINGLTLSIRFKAGKPCLSNLPVLKHKPKLITRAGEFESIPIKLTTVFVYKANVKGQKISLEVGYKFLNASGCNILIQSQNAVVCPGDKFMLKRNSQLAMDLDNLHVRHGWGNEVITLENAIVERGSTYPIIRGLSGKIETESICVVNSNKIKQKYSMFTGVVQEQLKLMSI